MKIVKKARVGRLALIVAGLVVPSILSLTMTGTASAAQPKALPPVNTPVHIKTAASRCLDVRSEDGPGVGARLQTFHCTGNDTVEQVFERIPVPGATTVVLPDGTRSLQMQLWAFAPAGGNNVTFRGCLQPVNDETASSAPIVIGGDSCFADTDPFTRWNELTKPGSQFVQYVNVGSGKALTVLHDADHELTQQRPVGEAGALQNWLPVSL